MSEIAKLKVNPSTVPLAFSESFKTLRTNIIYSNDAHVIVVASALPNEGKTLNAYNLAISFAQMEKKTLLLDCDLRKESMKRYFNLKDRPVGLSEFLSMQTGDVVYHTDLANLDVVFSGMIPPNPSELLSNGLLEKMIEQLRNMYDYIIIDTPPIAVSMDASIVGRFSDGVVMVIRNDFVSQKEVKKAVTQLERNGSKVLGAVLNRIKKSQAEYRNSYYGYSYYGKK